MCAVLIHPTFFRKPDCHIYLGITAIAAINVAYKAKALGETPSLPDILMAHEPSYANTHLR
ncbi:MAG: hypothetical protein ABL933_19245 [Methyloglobulus sp.]